MDRVQIDMKTSTEKCSEKKDALEQMCIYGKQ